MKSACATVLLLALTAVASAQITTTQGGDTTKASPTKPAAVARAKDCEGLDMWQKMQCQQQTPHDQPAPVAPVPTPPAAPVAPAPPATPSAPAASAALDVVLPVVKEYQDKLLNPDSMQLRVAYLTDEGSVCLEVGGQNAMGGMTVSRVTYFTQAWTGGPKRMRGHWAEPVTVGSVTIDGWRNGHCTKHGQFTPGTDVTKQVKQALKAEKAAQAAEQ